MSQLKVGIISQRSLTALNCADIYTVKDLLKYTEFHLLKMPGIGHKAIQEAKDFLASQGLSLPEIPPPKIPEFYNLRDYFAAHVITGLFSGKWGQIPSQKPEVAFANIAYLVADEMLKRREE
jgi:hypothetical protein